MGHYMEDLTMAKYQVLGRDKKNKPILEIFMLFLRHEYYWTKILLYFRIPKIIQRELKGMKAAQDSSSNLFPWLLSMLSTVLYVQLMTKCAIREIIAHFCMGEMN